MWEIGTLDFRPPTSPHHLFLGFGFIFTESWRLKFLFFFFFSFLSFISFFLWCAGIYLWNPDDFSFFLPYPTIGSWKEKEKLERSRFHQPEPGLNLLAPLEEMMASWEEMMALESSTIAWEFSLSLSFSRSIAVGCCFCWGFLLLQWVWFLLCCCCSLD